MPQRKSCCRFLQGSPAFLLVAKSEDLEKGSATQHRPKQLLQSASRLVWPAITRTPDGWVGRKVCPRVCESVKRNCVVRQQEVQRFRGRIPRKLRGTNPADVILDHAR